MSALHRTRLFLLALTAAALIGTCPAVAHAAPSTVPAKAPASTAPASKAPTKAPTTKAPVSQAPASTAPATRVPASTAPASTAPATAAPATPAPSTPVAKARPTTAAPTATPRPVAEKRVTALKEGRLTYSDGTAVFTDSLVRDVEHARGYVYLGDGQYLYSTVVDTGNGAGVQFSTEGLNEGHVYEVVLYDDRGYGELHQTFRLVDGRLVPIDQAYYGSDAQFRVAVDSPRSSQDALGLHFTDLEPGTTVPLRVTSPDGRILYSVQLVAGPDGTLSPRITLPEGWQPGMIYRVQYNELMDGEPGQWVWATDFMINADGTLTPVGPATRIPAQAGPGVKDNKADTARTAVSDEAPTGLPHTGV